MRLLFFPGKILYFIYIEMITLYYMLFFSIFYSYGDYAEK